MFNFQRMKRWLHRFEFDIIYGAYSINPLTPELNSSAATLPGEIFSGDFAS
jgi:hypothetical protein